MLGSDPSYLRAEGLEPSSVRGVIGVAGPYDFLPLTDPALIAMFGGAQLPQTQPIHAIDGKRPPMLLLTGTEDKTVLPRKTETAYAKTYWILYTRIDPARIGPNWPASILSTIFKYE